MERDPAASEIAEALEKNSTTRELRYHVLSTEEYLKKAHIRWKVYMHDIGDIGTPHFFQSMDQIGQECERLIDPSIDFIRFIESRDWQRNRLDKLRIKAKRVAHKSKINVALVVKQTFAEELEQNLSNMRQTVKSFPNSDALFDDPFCKEADVVITNANYLSTPELQKKWKEYLNPESGPIGVVWNYDNHHSFTSNIVKGSIFDIFVPAHTNYTDYLNIAKSLLVSPTPCGLAQWTPDFVRKGFRKFGGQQRSNKLDGGFTLHNYRGAYRGALIEELSTKLEDSDVRGIPFGKQGYWRNDQFENLKTWMSYKTSVSISINNDIPIRVFDALAVGQIPLVPSWLSGFDAIIPQREQERLPIVRYFENTAEEVSRAHKQAIALFDRDGKRGAKRRRDYCLKHHTLNQRYEDILDKVAQVIEAYK